ncbi:MAG: DUF126 domain-containing protein [Clostridiales bacterium]|nr:DUF126 domain-containing protein [Clostridiales bacterium]
MKQFKGRVVVPGELTAEAVVSKQGFNCLASFKKALLPLPSGKEAPCDDQNNENIYGIKMAGKALCLPLTIGSTTGGMIIYCVGDMGRLPACMLYSKEVDPVSAAGIILNDVWTDTPMPVIDKLGDEFLDYVQNGMKITIHKDGTVEVF